MMPPRLVSWLARASASMSEPGQPQDQSSSGWRGRDVHIDHFKPEAGDPLQQPGECLLIRQAGTESRYPPAYGDFTVVEFLT
jgi:hypothetical protein